MIKIGNGAKVKTWRSEKGYGIISVAGSDAFVHASALLECDTGIIGKLVYAKVIVDTGRGMNSYKATKVRREETNKLILAKEKA